jgi:hypothetical protein
MSSTRTSGSVRRLLSVLLLHCIAVLEKAPANALAHGKDRFFGRDAMEAAAGRWASPVRIFLVASLVGGGLDEDPHPSCRSGQSAALTRIGAVAAHGPSCRWPPTRKGRLGTTRKSRKTSQHLQAAPTRSV